jgi:hypothetical protein
MAKRVFDSVFRNVEEIAEASGKKYRKTTVIEWDFLSHLNILHIDKDLGCSLETKGRKGSSFEIVGSIEWAPSN